MAAVCVCTQVVFSPTASIFAFHWSIRLAFLLLVEGERGFFFPKPTKFDPDDPALVDRFPDYTPAIDIGDRPPTHEICSGRRPSKKKKYLYAIPEQSRRT
jgi:hypothetical protein